MAHLIDKRTNDYCFLYAHHTFGRYQYSVDTLVSDPSVSKIHTIIEWVNGKWFIRDLSLNGTWLNNKRLVKDEPKLLCIGDKIYFSGNSETTYVVKNLAAPADQLIRLDEYNKKTTDVISLSHYHLVPEHNPDHVVVFENSSGQWHLESLDDATQDDPEVLQDNHIITLGDSRWMFLSSHIDDVTQMSSVPQLYINDLEFHFNLSLDEEISELTIKYNNKEIDLHARCHHYLTLNLARYRAEDAQRGVTPANQGWVETDRLVKDLGVDMRYLNIQIHRARKQFSEVLTHVHDAENIIERQLRRVRFAGKTFEIYKGHELERTSNVATA
ncbi:hypothetical protein AMS58_04875 [Pseudoalteromonas porphyrae]|uniref:FHA domain-containing protein n=2 Tax=Pseudoalteromonas TaxID=53246 RepID=A0A0N1ES96_9GAMM|nr:MULTISPECIES: FHA domain-containing protein [Pseudoalteromonas]KPH65653.1 hypothetical protein ADS77_01625 [Pseudoalteromonas porphyrae]KPH95534.1 hypothetical protein AMS58_04875 [Pseudoalteromonas porphyrae]NNG41588.1 FHA domain-containing protein [Pseudoalteromonas sp. NEC-BIFX-2020_002]